MRKMKISKKRPILTEEEFDDLIDEWHDSDSKLEIYEYLEMTREEYMHYLNSYEDYVKYRKKGI